MCSQDGEECEEIYVGRTLVRCQQSKLELTNLLVPPGSLPSCGVLGISWNPVDRLHLQDYQQGLQQMLDIQLFTV